MIRAMVENGVIQPLEPLPPEWRDGRELVVADPLKQPGTDTADFDTWAQDMNRLTAELTKTHAAAMLRLVAVLNATHNTSLERLASQFQSFSARA